MGNIDQMTVGHILTLGFGLERCHVHATPVGRTADDREWDDRGDREGDELSPASFRMVISSNGK